MTMSAPLPSVARASAISGFSSRASIGTAPAARIAVETVGLDIRCEHLSDPSRPQRLRHARADRSGADDRDDVVGPRIGERRGVYAGRQHIADEQGALVIDGLGHPQEVHVCHGHPNGAGLRAVEVATERAAAEDAVLLAQTASAPPGRTSRRRTRCGTR